MSTPLPDPPHDDDLSAAEFHIALEDMLARVSAAANDAQRSRLESNGDVAADESSIEGNAEGAQTPAAAAHTDAAAPSSADDPAQVEADSSDVWADTTPFWPADPTDWLEHAGNTSSPSGPPPVPGWIWTTPKASDQPSSDASQPHADGSSHRAPPPGWMRRASPLAVALAVAVVVGWGAWQALPRGMSPPMSESLDGLPPTSAGPVAAAAVIAHAALPLRPALDIAIDADASTESRMLDELRQSVGAAGTATEPGVSPRLAIARYDTLPAASADWQVVATLGTEEVYALVPAGSPLRHLGDLRGRRINLGPDGSARAVSGAALYRALFGAAPSKSRSASLPRDDALRQMLATGELDALLLFDGQPSSWLAALPASTRHALRLLRLDPAEAAGRRALQSYLPGRVTPVGDSDGAPVPTLREVTFLIAPSSERNLAPVLHALCERLPALRADGHPKWREVDPTLSLPTGLQRPVQLAAVRDTCFPAIPTTSNNRRSS